MLARHKNDTGSKGISYFFLALITVTTFQPLNSFALTGGEIQIEYGAYESPGNSDMVNLLTGDFTYNLPLIYIPSPEGGFTMPIFYHGGVGTEQMASWVGLGWGLNAGAITRTPNNVPDDFDGQLMFTNSNYNGASGWSLNMGVFDLGYDSEVGHHGGVNLLSVAGVNWGAGRDAFNLAGLTFSNEGVTFSPEQAVLAAISVAAIAATAGAAAGKGDVLMSHVAGAVGTGLAYDAGLSLGFSIINSGTSSYSQGEWRKKESGFIFKNYKWELDHKAEEKSYGLLYQHNMPVDGGNDNNQAVIKLSVDGQSKVMDEILYDRAGDRIPERDQALLECLQQTGSFAGCNLHHYEFNNWVNEHPIKNDISRLGSYTDEHGELQATNQSPDNFRVMGQGVSGSISPYRLEVGSSAIPYSYPSVEVKHVKKFEDYKLGFAYNGYPFKGYAGNKTEIDGTPVSGSSLSRIGSEWSLSLLDDKIKPNFTVSPDNINTVGRMSGSKTTKKVVQGRNIEWYTNAEIISEHAFNDGVFLDFLPLDESKQWRNSLPQKGIGGYAVTREDGFTYHYALPSYTKETKTYMGDSFENEGTDFIIKDDYANSWLLTGITGPDFIDRGGENGQSNGIIDDKDVGYWVAFDYGKFSDNYRWRTPYTVKGYRDDGESGEAYGSGVRESYYLNTVKTRTHTGLFVKSERLDGRGYYYRDDQVTSSLKLDDVYVLKNEDYNQLINAYGVSTESGTEADGTINTVSGDSFDEVFDNFDIDQVDGAREFLRNKAIRDVRFNYSYKLCPGTLNSFKSSLTPPDKDVQSLANHLGKLTTESISVFGRGGIEQFPPFKFDYGSYNPSYNIHKHDNWGMYSRWAIANGYSHEPFQNDEDAAAWSLKKVLMPNGTELEIEYERDDYMSVNGEQIKVVLPVGSQDEDNLDVGYDDGNNEVIMFDGHDANIQAYDPRWYLVDDQAIVWNEGTIVYDGFGVIPIIPRPIEKNTVDQINRISFRPPYYTFGTNRIDDWADDLKDGDLNRDEYIVGEIVAPYKGGIHSRQGDKLRVKRLITNNGVKKHVQEYQYTKQGQSSGVVGSEPYSPTKYEYDFYSLYDNPSTGVMYQQVTVLDGLNYQGSYLSKQVYEFTTPHKNMVQQRTQEASIPVSGTSCLDVVAAYEGAVNIDVYTSRIGRINSVKQYDSKGFLVQDLIYNYNEPSILSEGYGDLSESTMFSETNVRENENDLTCTLGPITDAPDKIPVFQHYRTTKTYHPNILTSVTTRNAYDESTSKKLNFDQYTGQPHTMIEDNDLDVEFDSEIRPAYLVYPHMGPKALSLDNTNMLAQLVGGNVKYTNSAAVFGQSTSTWNETSLVRLLTETGEYQTEVSNVVRAEDEYIYDHPAVTGKGDIDGATPFYWSKYFNNEEQYKSWKKASSQTLYDEYSHILEVKDINGNYAMTQYDAKTNYPIASTSFAQYQDAGFSSFENGYAKNTRYTDGEILVGNQGFIASELAHSGKYSLKIGNGMGVSKHIPVSTYNANRKVVSQFWMHEDYAQGLHFKFKQLDEHGQELSNTGATGLIDVSAFDKFGSWYKIEVVSDPIQELANQVCIELYKNTGGANVYIDDLRVMPYESSMTSSVLDEQNRPWYHLGSSNTYTRYEYNERGEVVKVYVETPEGEKLVQESKMHYARD